jgi:O-antigen ligase
MMKLGSIRMGRPARPAAPAPAFQRRSSPVGTAMLIFGLMFAAVFSALVVVVTGYFSLLMILVLGLCALLLWDFRIGAVALMIFIPLSSTRFMPSFSGLNAQNLLLFGSLFSYGLFRMGHKVNYRLVDGRLLLCYLVPFVLAGLAGSRNAHMLAQLGLKGDEAVATSRGFILYYVIKPGLLVVMAWLIAAALRESKRPERFITAYTVGAMVPAFFIALYVPLSGVSLGELVNFRSFLSVLGLHANQFAVVLNFGIATLLFAGLATESKGQRTFLLGVAVFLVATLLLTFSRGGYVGLMIIAMAYVIYFRDGSKLLLALLVLAIGAFFIPDAVVQRITLGITHGSHQDLSSGRIEGIWLPLLPRVLDSPLWGHGLLYVGRSTLVASGEMMKVEQAHNAYLDLLLDSGLIGLVLVMTFLIRTYRDFRTLAVTDPHPMLRGFFRGASVGMLAWLAQAFTDDRLFPNIPQMLFWMSYGVLLARNPAMLKMPKLRRKLHKMPASVATAAMPVEVRAP